MEEAHHGGFVVSRHITICHHQFYRCIDYNRRQHLAKFSGFLLACQDFFVAVGDQFEIGENLCDAAEFIEQRNRPFFANAFDPRDVIRAIAFESAQISELIRFEATIALDDFGFVIDN